MDTMHNDADTEGVSRSTTEIPVEQLMALKQVYPDARTRLVVSGFLTDPKRAPANAQHLAKQLQDAIARVSDAHRPSLRAVLVRMQAHIAIADELAKNKERK